ncbi:MAG: M50 family metallopeptidase [Candidatus Dojkabacteria bacterium]|nr:M50 family metallopeptidase [Candidatus Dojkabacteria bacterium]MDQ7021700.1 M50 family metallopeptidase [Candidatus Dojkabacteria bacterium]
MDFLLTIFFFLLILSFLVLVHEFGHFAAAKLMKVDVHEFAIGFGPILIQKEFKGTKYQLRAIPLGGFVQLEGEAESKSPNGFRNKSLLPKVFILSAGIMMNILTAIVLLFINFQIQEYTFVIPAFSEYEFNNVERQNELFPIRITGVKEDGDSAEWLKRGDYIVGFNDEYIKSESEFLKKLGELAGKDVTVNLLNINDFSIESLEVKLGDKNEEGFVLDAAYDLPFESDFGNTKTSYFVKYKENLLSPIAHTYDLTIFQVKALGSIISDSIKENDYETLSNSVGGPVAVGGTVNDVVEEQVYEAFFFLAALISISLAMVNILPFPALDGGQIAVAVAESLRGKKFKDSTLEKINLAGFSFLILLSILITIKDVVNLGIIGNIGDFIKSALGK